MAALIGHAVWLQCAMLLHDATGRSRELFKVFSQYPEELLLAVFNCMKNDGLITKIKVRSRVTSPGA